MYWGYDKYERLPNFCFLYGHIDHTMRNCPSCLSELSYGQRRNLSYEAWLNAPKDENDLVKHCSIGVDGVGEGEGVEELAQDRRDGVTARVVVPFIETTTDVGDGQEESVPSIAEGVDEGL